MNLITQETQNHWVAISPLFSIHNEEEYDLAVERLNNLIDWVGTDEQHPFYDLLDILGMVVQAYEEKHYPMPECRGIDMLKFFMDEHGLNPLDLPEIGNFAVVSDILNQKKALSVEQIKMLSERFLMSPAMFI
ncbi:transcriptional regulator [Candidatus Marithioploca araucensis]|uniref:Transcriptional regulator n=1 Tax=Candidatus Marithioploca araucensis TaxID=70273 RepID=A0ABT7VUY3_9GAMM|nr:transcriptional regulator [Candidatus Marithioploca araucensis]